MLNCATLRSSQVKQKPAPNLLQWLRYRGRLSAAFRHCFRVAPCSLSLDVVTL